MREVVEAEAYVVPEAYRREKKEGKEGGTTSGRGGEKVKKDRNSRVFFYRIKN